MRPAVRPRHRLRHERVRRLDWCALGRTHGRRRMAREGLAAPDPRDGHRHLRRGLAAARARRRGLQVGPEGRLVPRSGPAAVPRRPHALGHGQPPGDLLVPARRRHARPARETTRRRPTTCSSARKAATPAGPTTPTTSSPRPPKACTPPATAYAAPSTSLPSPGPASPSAAATAGTRPQTSPTAPGRTWSASSSRTTTGTRTPPGSTPQASARSSRWTAAATPCRAWTASTCTSRSRCAQRLCDVLEDLWQDALAERYKINAHSPVAFLDRLLRLHEERQDR